MSVKVFLRGLICLTVASSGMFCLQAGHSEVLDKVAVVVNDEVVTQREFDRAFLPIKKNYEQNFKGEELESRLDDVKKMLLEQMINTKLAISVAKKSDIVIPDPEIQERVDKIKTYYGSEEDFLKALDERGTTYTEFTKEIKEQMMAQKIVEQEVSANIVVTPTEIDELYENNKSVLIAPPRAKVQGFMIKKTDDPKADRKKIEAALERIKSGEDFNAVAKESSEGPYAERGGDMGVVIKGQMLPEMDKAIFETGQGGLTDIVETNLGLHFFQILDKEDERQLERNEVNDFLRSQLFKKKFEEKIVEWMKEKRKNAYISYK